MQAGQRNKLIGAVVVFAAAAGLYFGLNRHTVGMPETVKTYGVCLACQEENEVDAPISQAAPFPCAKCGEAAVYPWYICDNCKRRFVPEPIVADPEDGVRRVPPSPRCSACRSFGGRPWIQKLDPEYAGNAKLPKWPPQ